MGKGNYFRNYAINCIKSISRNVMPGKEFKSGMIFYDKNGKSELKNICTEKFTQQEIDNLRKSNK